MNALVAPYVPARPSIDNVLHPIDILLGALLKKRRKGEENKENTSLLYKTRASGQILDIPPHEQTRNGYLETGDEFDYYFRATTFENSFLVSSSSFQSHLPFIPNFPFTFIPALFGSLALFSLDISSFFLSNKKQKNISIDLREINCENKDKLDGNW